VFAKRGLNGQQMLSRYVLPLTAQQMTKLGSTIGIKPIGNEIPAKFILSQNYPNPFNPSTVIKFSLPKNTNAELKVFNSLGHEVATLVKYSALQAGNYEVEFDGRNLSSGIYFYRLTTPDYAQTMKMVLIK
jgi:hypothetical protein